MSLQLRWAGSCAVDSKRNNATVAFNIEPCFAEPEVTLDLDFEPDLTPSPRSYSPALVVSGLHDADEGVHRPCAELDPVCTLGRSGLAARARLLRHRPGGCPCRLLRVRVRRPVPDGELLCIDAAADRAK